MMPRTDRRWIAVIGGMLAVITAVRLLADDSRLGLALPSILPVILAAYCFGRRAAMVTAAVATVLFAVSTRDLEGGEMAVATLTRAIVFFGVGLLVAELLRREGEQSRLIAEQHGELEELRVLREALVPATVPETPGLDVATAYVAAEGQAAGDFFLVVSGPHGRTLLAVGDAVGHGVAAARRAAYARAMLATFAAYDHDPARLLELANTALMESDPSGMNFITAVCALVHDDRVTWSSAGHPAPWDLDTGMPLATDPPHEPLGIARDLRYGARTANLPRDHGFLLFSDGLTEARHAGGSEGRRLLGEGPAREQLLAHRGEPPASVVQALRATACDFAGGALADDLCLLAARRT